MQMILSSEGQNGVCHATCYLPPVSRDISRFQPSLASLALQMGTCIRDMRESMKNEAFPGIVCPVIHQGLDPSHAGVCSMSIGAHQGGLAWL
jgi:hypothetical protein